MAAYTCLEGARALSVSRDDYERGLDRHRRCGAGTAATIVSTILTAIAPSIAACA
jgi:hypothetical protein